MGIFDNVTDQLLNSSRDMKAPSDDVMAQYKEFVKTLTPEQKKAERSKLAAASRSGSPSLNRFIKERVRRFSSATSKEVKDAGGQQKKGALARGGKARRYSTGGSVRGRKANYKI
ncbi:MAG: hypothetical protein CM15mV47_850 [uncultured marine virus]|nr:MAG: hypothetical protein CM15mV47_850 [uncultured marine virus]